MTNKLLENLKKYWEFSKDLEETDENIINICQEIKSVDINLIYSYYKDLIRYIIQQKNYKATIPFFRVITLNRIREQEGFLFKSLKEFSDYVENFKKKLEDENFPNNIKGVIEKLKNIPIEEINGQTYEFNFDLVKECIKIKTESLNKQFANYGGFNYFRHFKIYYTKEGIELNKELKNMWDELYEFFLDILEVSREDYYIGYSSFFKGTERYETDFTWAGFVKREIGDIEIEEDKTKSFQLFLSISYKGISIGTFLGLNTNKQLEGFLKANVEKNRNHIINIFKFLKKKYGAHIRLSAKNSIMELEDNLNDLSYQNSVIDIYKVNFSIRYYDFQGEFSEFEDIIKDFFKLYKLMTEGIIDIGDSYKFLEDNLKKYNLISFKDKIFENLKEIFIGIPLLEIIEKILKLLNSGKHIILNGAPGTGKTMILEKIFKLLKVNTSFIKDIVFTTATSDWTVFETIGGLIPYANKLDFQPGILLRCFKENGQFANKWLIIDELNRANIDKAFGSFFSLLSNQEVELPFKTYKGEVIKVIPLIKWLSEGIDKSQIIKKINDSSNFERYFISPLWRIGGTLNTSDKASLHQLSHAFIRRFGFVYIPIPDIEKFMDKYKFKSSEKNQSDIKKIWKLVNEYFEIGPAIIIDIDSFLENSSFKITDAFESFILPQLESLPYDIFNELIEKLKKEFSEDNQIASFFNNLKIKDY
ncbi:MAG: AAA family ATPase [Promethearchaeota archaeon]